MVPVPVCGASVGPDENGYLIFCKFIVIFSRFCIYSKTEGDEEREATIQTKQALVLMCACSSAIGYTTPPAVLFISHLLEIYSSHLSLSDALSQVVVVRCPAEFGLLWEESHSAVTSVSSVQFRYQQVGIENAICPCYKHKDGGSL